MSFPKNWKGKGEKEWLGKIFLNTIVVQSENTTELKIKPFRKAEISWWNIWRNNCCLCCSFATNTLAWNVFLKFLKINFLLRVLCMCQRWDGLTIKLPFRLIKIMYVCVWEWVCVHVLWPFVTLRIIIFKFNGKISRNPFYG